MQRKLVKAQVFFESIAIPRSTIMSKDLKQDKTARIRMLGITNQRLHICVQHMT